MATPEQNSPDQETTGYELFEIHNSPDSFRDLVEQSARELGFKISKIEFDVVVSREVEEDGTEHLTIKPFILTGVEHIENSDSHPVLVLTKREITYAFRQESWGGNIYGGGDQTIYSKISVIKLREDTPLTALRPNVVLEPPSKGRIYYSHGQNWVAGAESDYVESDKYQATISRIGGDALLNDVASNLERRKQVSTT